MALFYLSPLSRGEGVGRACDGWLSRHRPLHWLAHAEPDHEALADLNGVTMGRGAGGFGIDPRRDQVWLVARQRRLDEAVEIGFIRGPRAAGKPCAAGDGDKVGAGLR